MNMDDVVMPDTTAVRAAMELASIYQPESLTAHAIRSGYWSEAIARVVGIAIPDRELLWVAALLHDIGIVPEFDNHLNSYEDAGGHVAVALTAGAGWPHARRLRVHEVIVRHNWPSVDPALDVEGHLLERATALDVAGAQADLLPSGFAAEVLASYPRGDLAQVFGKAVTGQSERKPHTQARRIVQAGVVAKMAEHPHEARAGSQGR
ncbi:HD domain-containing protein [Falsarthrobacter nasiphocae]|uniref:HD superfamily phosphodiesterase n=1 Tax=Falsarthrobacter nasiphocae TaxID=189863 RepID=A0AAE3YHI3_9MICC|nr:HD domain-containing protein [Falsarthrobacter nasiphocae]MDR6892121.1 HD superfamily phosphodiesterase [Falsarthrobacter nasiphocae]